MSGREDFRQAPGILEWFGKVYRSNVIEENLGEVGKGGDSCYRMTVKLFEIFTVGLESSKSS